MIISGIFSCEDVLFCVVTEHPDISNTPKANKNGITAMYLDFMLCTSTIFSDFFWILRHYNNSVHTEFT